MKVSPILGNSAKKKSFPAGVFFFGRLRKYPTRVFKRLVKSDKRRRLIVAIVAHFSRQKVVMMNSSAYRQAPGPGGVAVLGSRQHSIVLEDFLASKHLCVQDLEAGNFASLFFPRC